MNRPPDGALLQWRAEFSAPPRIRWIEIVRCPPAATTVIGRDSESWSAASFRNGCHPGPAVAATGSTESAAPTVCGSLRTTDSFNTLLPSIHRHAHSISGLSSRYSPSKRCSSGFGSNTPAATEWMRGLPSQREISLNAQRAGRPLYAVTTPVCVHTASDLRTSIRPGPAQLLLPVGSQRDRGMATADRVLPGVAEARSTAARDRNGTARAGQARQLCSISM